jgi:von Willebrand factor type A domain
VRRPNRDIAIFTLSALDVLAMSAGVFVLLLVMLMPYYRKSFDAEAEIEAVRVATTAMRAEVQSVEATGARYRAEADAAEADASELLAQAASLEQATRQRLRLEVAKDPGPPVIEAIDLVFVIDTSASMTPVMRDLAIAMRGVVRILERLVPSVRIGISAYKDHDIPVPPVITFPLTPTDPFLPRIVGFLDSMEASPIGSRTLDEDVHRGLEAATRMRWRPDAKQVMVLIGDAEAHPENENETLWRIRNFVQGNELRSFSALFVTTPSSLSAGNIARFHFQGYAQAGNGTFHDHTGSMIESVLVSVLAE